MFKSLLVANRGEIACRIIKTARRMGLRTIAVYSEADAQAAHVDLADEAYLIGPAAAAESYLRIEKILEVAAFSGADAIHPGYGFLSENADFAEACAQAGVIFVGPPASAIRAMGSKSEAKAIMGSASVPLVPGYHGDNQDPAFLLKESEAIGFPVLIKASAGGGGKGMRVVHKAEDFQAELEGAQREARASFGDDQVLVEKYLTQPRHIEVQVFADSLGQAVSLFERDCSVQRRHQKVLEEAPAPGMTEDKRREMGEAAVAAAQAIGYQGAGTVEFIAEGEHFYFMEMNTRLQVEHPVTELITGQDLVEWQLRVANGEGLPLSQEELTITGHAFEARLYAEDPARDFLPATGLLSHLVFPPEDDHLRIDTGVRQGDSVSAFYDPMIAKVIVWDENRDAALSRLSQALAKTEVVGVTTNRDLLWALADHPAFAAADLDTGFIGKHDEVLLAPPQAPGEEVLALAALAECLRRDREARRQAERSGDAHSPWHLTNGWQMNEDTQRPLLFKQEEADYPLVLHYRAQGRKHAELEVELWDRLIKASAEDLGQGRLLANLDGRQFRASAVWQGEDLTLFVDGRSYQLHLFNALEAVGEDEAVGGQLRAPLSGKIIAVSVAEGQQVQAGDTLMLLEAMKMEHAIVAGEDGQVTSLFYGVGDQVDEGAELLALETPEEK
ncbi:ATP-binding protein [Rhodovibrionaceae bacterium A322]